MSEYRQQTKCLSAWVAADEFEAFIDLATRNNVGLSDMLRAIVIDALYEEGFRGRIRQAGHSQATESSEASRAAQ